MILEALEDFRQNKEAGDYNLSCRQCVVQYNAVQYSTAMPYIVSSQGKTTPYFVLCYSAVRCVTCPISNIKCGRKHDNHKSNGRRRLAFNLSVDDFGGFAQPSRRDAQLHEAGESRHEFSIDELVTYDTTSKVELRVRVSCIVHPSHRTIRQFVHYGSTFHYASSTNCSLMLAFDLS